MEVLEVLMRHTPESLGGCTILQVIAETIIAIVMIPTIAVEFARARKESSAQNEKRTTVCKTAVLMPPKRQYQNIQSQHTAIG